MIEAGRELSEILLPPEVYGFLLRSRERVGDDGLRLRLCLDDVLIDGPWEFLYLPNASEGDPLDGFLVLDSHLSLVREAPVESSKLEPTDEQQRMIIVGAFQVNKADPYEVRKERLRLIEALEPVQEFLSIDRSFESASGDNIEKALITEQTLASFGYARCIR